MLSRVATTYYFVHFLFIIPFLGFFEKTKPLPISISEPVLGGSSANLSYTKSEKIKINL